MYRRGAATFSVIAMLVAVMSGCTSAGTPPSRDLVMGTADDPAMRVVTQIYAATLRGAGAPVAAKPRVGDYPSLLDGMERLEVDLFPAFTGALLDDLAPQLAPTSGEDVYDDLNGSLPQGVSVGDATTVSAVPQVFVATETARTTGVTELADCGRLPAGLPLATAGALDPRVLAEFVEAGCRFGPIEELDSTRAVITRVADGRAAGVVTALDAAGDDADGAIGSVQALSVPQPEVEGPEGDQATPTSTTPAEPVIGPRAEDLVPVYRSAALSGDQVKAMNKVAGELTTADLATMAREVRGGAAPAEVAATWLAEHGLT